MTITLREEPLVVLSKFAESISVVRANNLLNIGLTNFGCYSTSSDNDSRDNLPASSSDLIASIEVYKRRGKTFSNYFKKLSF